MGLYDWFKHVFTHYGWMLLHKPTSAKVVAYKESVQNLLTALVEKIQTVENADKKADLKIIYDKVYKLRLKLEEDFGSTPMTGGASKKALKKGSKKGSKKGTKKAKKV